MPDGCRMAMMAWTISYVSAQSSKNVERSEEFVRALRLRRSLRMVAHAARPLCGSFENMTLEYRIPTQLCAAAANRSAEMLTAFESEGCGE